MSLFVLFLPNKCLLFSRPRVRFRFKIQLSFMLLSSICVPPFLVLFSTLLVISAEECEPIIDPPLSTTEWIWKIAIVVLLNLFSALFSGLTLGLMSLDKIGLEIVIGAGEAENASADEKEQAKCAKTIYPVRANGNLLLTTLLLGNVAVNALLSILLADLFNGIVGFLVSTAIIVMFGEILPQALCSRYALKIGSIAIPIVKLIMGILYILAKPISVVLDKMLGEEIGNIHSKLEVNITKWPIMLLILNACCFLADENVGNSCESKSH